MKIIESLCLGKAQNQQLNEDRLVMTSDFVAVLDGVTSKGGPAVSGMSRGRFATLLLEDVLESLPPDSSLALALETIGHAFAQAYASEAVDPDASPELRYMASVAVYSRARREVWSLGDCVVLVDGLSFLHVTDSLERASTAARALWLESEILQGRTLDELLLHDTGRGFVTPLIRRAALFANRDHPLGFPVVDGLQVPERLRLVRSVPLNAQEVVIASDGYPEVLPTLAASEARLAEILERDPLCFREHKAAKGRYPGQSSFDDRTYVRISIAQ